MPESLLFEQLTTREYEVLNLIAAGYSNQDIANKLVVARSTAKWHVRQIYNKMGVENRRQAIARARAAGILPSATSISTRPKHNLPAQITPFIGRQTELAELNHLLAEQRLITILGPGGMGKTRLALAVAEQQVAHFDNGIYFVPLAALTDSANLVMTIAEHSDYQLQSGQREPRQQLFDYFREKNLLLVLDNFEHLLDAVQLVVDILEAAPKVKVLATSRELLGLYGETVYSLSGMPLTSHDADAIQLFVERASRTQSDFTLNEGNLADVTRICQLVGGLPLGIELAAAWLRTLMLGDIATELQQGLDILETRTHSLRAVFERSWRLMTDKQQQAFMRLSVFRGGCTRMAAESVTDVGLRALQNLVDKSLLWRTPTGRFEMHELLRQYAAEKLDASGEVESIRDAHMNYYADALHQRTTELGGPKEQDFINDIESDFDNVCAAWNWAALRRDTNALRSMVRPLEVFAWIRGLAQIKDTLCQFAAAQLEVNPDVQQRLCLGYVLVGRATALIEMGQHTQAESVVRQALEIAHEFGEKKLIAWSLTHLGRAVSDLEEAERFLKASLQLHTELGDKQEQSSIYYLRGITAESQGRLKEAHEHYLQCIALCREIGNYTMLAWALGSAANYYFNWGQAEAAHNALHESLMLFRQMNNRPGLAWLLTTAAVAASEVNLNEAHRLIAECLVINRELGEPSTLVIALDIAGVLAEIRGDDAESARLLNESLSYAELSPFAIIKTRAKLALAWMYCIQGEFRLAAVYLSDGLPVLLEHHRTIGLAWNMPTITRILAWCGQPERAIELLGLAVHTHPREIKKWNLRPHWRSLLADLEAELGTEIYQAAFERGKSLELEVVVTELIVELRDIV